MYHFYVPALTRDTDMLPPTHLLADMAEDITDMAADITDMLVMFVDTVVYTVDMEGEYDRHIFQSNWSQVRICKNIRCD